MKSVTYVLLSLICFAGLYFGYLSNDQLIDERVTRDQSDLHSFAQKLNTFRANTGRLPTTEEGLKALVECPPGIDPHRWYQQAERIPNDPWGHPYQYIASPDKLRGYDLYSLGKDPKSSSDDIHIDNERRK